MAEERVGEGDASICLRPFVPRQWYGTSLYQTARSVEFSNHREQGSHGQIYMFRYRDVGEEKLGEREREATKLDPF